MTGRYLYLGARRSHVEDLQAIEVECAIGLLGFSLILPFNHNSHPRTLHGLQHDPGLLRVKEMEQAARLARLEHSKAEMAMLIAAAAAVQNAAEERAFMDPTAAAEERNAEWERGWK